MNVVINGNKYDVIIQRKKNKHTYLRVKEDLGIYVTTNYFVSKREIANFIDDNIDSIRNMISKELSRQNKKDDFYYLGQTYEVTNKSELDGVDKWYRKQAEKVFEERFNYVFSKFEGNISRPIIRIRKMKSRWGVCNRRLHKITLNLELIKKDVNIIDYVILHELCHFIHFNHSKKFWELVSYYIPNYKELRKILKE
ncbi:MAG: SprT family zinc-dependent metalloprotease [Bacilli bacterium]